MTQVRDGTILVGKDSWEFQFFGSEHDVVWISWDSVGETFPRDPLRVRHDFRVPTTIHEVRILSISLYRTSFLHDSFLSQ